MTVTKVLDLVLLKIGFVGEGPNLLETSLSPGWWLLIRSVDAFCAWTGTNRVKGEHGICVRELGTPEHRSGPMNAGGIHREGMVCVAGRWCLAHIDLSSSYCFLQKGQLVEKVRNNFLQLICTGEWRMYELLRNRRPVYIVPHSCLDRFLLRSRLDKGNLSEDSL